MLPSCLKALNKLQSFASLRALCHWYFTSDPNLQGCVPERTVSAGHKAQGTQAFQQWEWWRALHFYTGTLN